MGVHGVKPVAVFLIFSEEKKSFMIEICLPDDVWECILLHDTRNIALDAVNRKSRAIMCKARKLFPHGRFRVSFHDLMTPLTSVPIQTGNTRLRSEGNASCTFSIEARLLVFGFIRALYDDDEPFVKPTTSIDILCDKYSKEIEFSVRLDGLTLTTKMPFVIEDRGICASDLKISRCEGGGAHAVFFLKNK